MRTVILINGLKRSGKDHTAGILREKLGEEKVQVLSFAEPLKQIVADTFDISIAELEELKNKSEALFLEEPKIHGHEYYKMTDFRTILQRFGTEGMKPQFGEAVWANVALSKITENFSEYVIIPDFRFNIESDVIKSSNYRVVTLKIRNDDLPTADLHASERELDDYHFDHEIDNTGYAKNLDKKVEDFIKKFDIVA